jgi:hypothetical protein
MIEIQLETVLIFVGALILLGVGFLGLIFFLVYQRLRNPNQPKGHSVKSSSSSARVIKGIEAGQRFLDDELSKVVNRSGKKPDSASPQVNDVPLLPDFQPLVTLFRNPVNQKLVVLLPGETKPALPQALNPIESERLAQAHADFDVWLHPQKTPQNKPEKPQPISTPPTSPSTPIIHLAKPAVPAGGDWVKKTEPVEEKNMSMASQVNEILQSMLVSDRYQGPEIRVMDGLHGDLVIWVGARKFIGIEEVPDPTVVERIRAAANYWADMNFKQ